MINVYPPKPALYQFFRPLWRASHKAGQLADNPYMFGIIRKLNRVYYAVFLPYRS